jgi:hypothetical protein
MRPVASYDELKRLESGLDSQWGPTEGDPQDRGIVCRSVPRAVFAANHEWFSILLTDPRKDHSPERLRALARALDAADGGAEGWRGRTEAVLRDLRRGDSGLQMLRFEMEKGGIRTGCRRAGPGAATDG